MTESDAAKRADGGVRDGAGACPRGAAMTGRARRAGPMAALALALCAAAPVAAQAPSAAVRSAPSGAQVAGEPPAASGAAAWRAVLDRYCVTCHNGRLRTGNLVLDGVDTERVGADAEVWEKVLRKLRTRAMPPPRRPRPAVETYGAFAAWLEAALDRAAAERPNPGRPTIHRLNRLEYANAVRDLLDLEIDGAALLPGDNLAYGFDNNADVLTVAPGLLERYLAAARRISRLAVGDPTIESDAVRAPQSALLAQDDRMSEDLPFGSRGGAAVRRHFPLDGEYVVRIALRYRGRGGPEEIDVRVDGVRVALLRVGQWPEGADLGGARVVEPGRNPTVRFSARAGLRVVSASFTRRTAVTEGMAPRRLPLWTYSSRVSFGKRMTVRSLEIEGPFSPDTLGRGPGDEGETATRRRIFVCRPAAAEEEERCAGEILGTLARRAFRRPVTALDVDALRAFWAEGRREGGFDAGIQRALESLLVDPEFLFRIERDPPGVEPGAPYRLSAVELASRLSFFLWSSIPDDQLLDAAETGTLGDPAELERQVLRMLADDKADALVSSFVAQWLHLRRMRTVTPDVNAFPDFDENLRDALLRETEMFVESQLQEDRSVVDLLDADYTFVNERLARHYGIPNVYGSRFRRVDLPDERRGLLGHGSILTVTSPATRTSPVVRGKWVLENVLGAPPPPPPPDVPDLPERAGDGRGASLRARLEAHRANPVCSGCHARMDPLGFALENFDAVGRWRAADAAGAPIDTAGVLPDGTAVAGFAGLRDLLLERREEFVTTVVEKLLTYALGRGVEYYDRPAVRAIVREAAPHDYRWSALILGVARSLPFQMRKADS